MQYSGIRDKVAIVTGAGEGIGYAIAAMLLEAGANVVLNDIDEKNAKKVANTLAKGHSGRCFPYAGDAGDVSVIHAMVDFTLSKFGKIDFVIPNAGITLFGDFFDFKPEDFQKVIDLNLRGAFFLAQRTASEMRKRGNGGRIILMSSITGIQAYSELTAYSMTKAALRMLSRSLAMTLGPYGIMVNTIAPGAILTERTKNEQPDYEGAWAKLNPNGEVGRPEDIAHACLFLLSDEARHINGQTIVVDGGWTVAGKYPEDLP